MKWFAWATLLAGVLVAVLAAVEGDWLGVAIGALIALHNGGELIVRHRP